MHVPAKNENLVVMEVKSASGEMNEIQKDIKTLNTFIEEARYKLGILLIYGEIEENRLKQIIEKIEEKNPRIKL